MKYLIKLSLASLFLSCILVGCANAQDLSTDDAVIAELQKRVDAKRAGLGTTGDVKLDAKRNAGGRLDAPSVCVRRLKESASVIIIGSFANDIGCRLNGAFVDSRYFEKDDASLSKNALAALGWKTATGEQREQMAKVWVEKGLLAFFTVHRVKNEDFQNREFKPPQVLTKENGEVVVTLWMQLPSGMRPERKYQLLEHRFTRDGDLSATSTLEKFVH